MYALKVYANHYLERVIAPKEYKAMLADEVDANYGELNYLDKYLDEHLGMLHSEVFVLTEEEKEKMLVDYKAWLFGITEADLIDEGWECVVLHIEQSDLTYVGEDISDEAEELASAEASADTEEVTDTAVAN